MFNPLRSGMNQELFEKHHCNQSSYYEKHGRFPSHYKGKPSHATAKSTHFSVSKDDWDTKDSGKSMKNALYILQYAKGTSRAKAMLNSQKTKPIAIAIIKLC